MSGRKTESMNERWLLARIDAALSRDVLQADDPRPEDAPEQDRSDDDVLHDPVEHRSTLPPPLLSLLRQGVQAGEVRRTDHAGVVDEFWRS